MKDVGRTIRILRTAKGFSSAELCRRAEISKPFLSLVESGDRQPSLSVLRKISDALAIPSEALVMLAMADSSTLSSNDGRVRSLIDSVQELTMIEDKLRKQLKS